MLSSSRRATANALRIRSVARSASRSAGRRSRKALTVFEGNAPGEGPPLHVHTVLDEMIYVIDGTIRVRLEDRIDQAAAGARASIPRGTPHTWAVVSDRIARLLVVVAPAGLEQFFDRTASAGGGEADDAFSRFGGDLIRRSAGTGSGPTRSRKGHLGGGGARPLILPLGPVSGNVTRATVPVAILPKGRWTELRVESRQAAGL